LKAHIFEMPRKRLDDCKLDWAITRRVHITGVGPDVDEIRRLA
jgi:hypothetical protein